MVRTSLLLRGLLHVRGDPLVRKLEFKGATPRLAVLGIEALDLRLPKRLQPGDPADALSALGGFRAGVGSIERRKIALGEAGTVVGHEKIVDRFNGDRTVSLEHALCGAALDRDRDLAVRGPALLDRVDRVDDRFENWQKPVRGHELRILDPTAKVDFHR